MDMVASAWTVVRTCGAGKTGSSRGLGGHLVMTLLGMASVNNLTLVYRILIAAVTTL